MHHLRPSETVVSKPSVMEDVDEEDVFQPNKRFRKARRLDEESKVLAAAVPKATGYKNKWQRSCLTSGKYSEITHVLFLNIAALMKLNLRISKTEMYRSRRGFRS